MLVPGFLFLNSRDQPFFQVPRILRRQVDSTTISQIELGSPVIVEVDLDYQVEIEYAFAGREEVFHEA